VGALLSATLAADQTKGNPAAVSDGMAEVERGGPGAKVKHELDHDPIGLDRIMIVSFSGFALTPPRSGSCSS